MLSRASRFVVGGQISRLNFSAAAAAAPAAEPAYQSNADRYQLVDDPFGCKVFDQTNPDRFAAARDQYRREGHTVIRNFVSDDLCIRLLDDIRNSIELKDPTKRLKQQHEYKESDMMHNTFHEGAAKPLQVQNVPGRVIEQKIPFLWRFYKDLNVLVNKVSGLDLNEMSNKNPTLNCLIAYKGQSFGLWHYDRNAVTANLYLTTVENGATEYYPNYRIHLGKIRPMWQYSRLQHYIDKIQQTKFMRDLFGGTYHKVPCVRGTLIIFRGDRSLHRGAPNESDDVPRVNIVCAYDLPGNICDNPDHDAFLYGHYFEATGVDAKKAAAADATNVQAKINVPKKS
eukprot:gnl/Spiro4/22277_TR10970_c0_g1_i1.p1 gnl/Spiro4/22277_TR10970_c0_g1~~gnl/Spiro4/22277_TR10970_c0_g1_i1.p1  ORF type:complete len:341 (+),score=76.20 gnl/Spiro4/22277_TR10970_c0_g1_i1:90-1112(+)